MTPEELDRALAEALSVEPPAGYVARVRARVAFEQATSAGGRTWWPLGALAAGALVVVASGLMLEHESAPVSVATVTSRDAKTFEANGNNPAASRTTRSRAAGREGAPVPTVAASGDSAGPIRHQPRASATNAGGFRRSTDAPPAVLISPDDTAGARLLVTFAEAVLLAPATGGSQQEELQISRIDVAPIEVDSLPKPTPLVLGELQ